MVNLALLQYALFRMLNNYLKLDLRTFDPYLHLPFPFSHPIEIAMNLSALNPTRDGLTTVCTRTEPLRGPAGDTGR